jgi:hypothetical protein
MVFKAKNIVIATKRMLRSDRFALYPSGSRLMKRRMQPKKSTEYSTAGERSVRVIEWIVEEYSALTRSNDIDDLNKR